jgi:hypothetical protein
MPHYTVYACSECGRVFTRDEAHRGALVRKSISFLTLGPKPRTEKSRTVALLCTPCRDSDPDYKRESNRGPGQISEGLERVRRAQVIEARRSGLAT